MIPLESFFLVTLQKKLNNDYIKKGTRLYAVKITR